MTTEPEKRSTHGDEAAKIIISQALTQFLTGETVGLHDFLTVDEVQIVGEIVSAHSDPKDDTGELIRRSLADIAKRGVGGPRKRIRVGLLGALLRFADELDCTSRRIEDRQALELARFKGVSEEHMRRCLIVRRVAPTRESRNEIEIELNEALFDVGGDVENDLRLALQVETKIR